MWLWPENRAFFVCKALGAVRNSEFLVPKADFFLRNPDFGTGDSDLWVAKPDWQVPKPERINSNLRCVVHRADFFLEIPGGELENADGEVRFKAGGADS